jgi:glutamine synthetase
VTKYKEYKMGRKDILKEIKDHNINIVWLQFVDILGFPKLVEISVKALPKILDEGIAFDGSSIEGFARIEESDMILKPDPATFSIFPWTIDSEIRIGRIMCDVYDKDKKPFMGAPRTVLKKAVKEAEELGFIMQNGVEEEFFLFKLGKNGEPTTDLVSNGSYFEMLPEDIGEKTRTLIAKNLEEMVLR